MNNTLDLTKDQLDGVTRLMAETIRSLTNTSERDILEIVALFLEDIGLSSADAWDRARWAVSIEQQRGT